MQGARLWPKSLVGQRDQLRTPMQQSPISLTDLAQRITKTVDPRGLRLTGKKIAFDCASWLNRLVPHQHHATNTLPESDMVRSFSR
jgi:hypothetical protein